MKKYAAILLAMTFLGNTYAYALPDVEISQNTVTVTVTVGAGEKTTLFVAKADASSEDDDEVYAIHQTNADKDGKAIFSFAIPEEKNSESTDGEYIIYAKATGKEMQVGNFFFASFTKRENAITAIKNEDIESVLDNNSNEIALKSLGIEIDLYKELTIEQKDSVVNIIKKGFEYITEDEEYINVVNSAILLEFLNNDSTQSSSYIEKLGLTFEEKKFNDIEDEKLKDYIVQYIYTNRKYESLNTVKKSYDKANALYIINNTRFTNIEKILADYADILEIKESNEYKQYVGLLTKDKTNQNLVSKLSESPTYSVADLISKIGSSITVTSIQGDSSGGNSSGSGGSSGSAISSNKGSSNLVPGISSSIPGNITIQKESFTDITHVPWAKEAIEYLYKKGIISGDGDSKFDPDRNLTREEFVKMLVAAMNIHDKNAECDFNDVKKDKWYYSYVASAFKSGIAKGISETEFGIGKYLSRQDMAVMCCRAIKGKTLEEVREYKTFADEDKINDYAREDIITLYKSGVINGVSEEYFDPAGTATRAQGAVIIYNLFK